MQELKLTDDQVNILIAILDHANNELSDYYLREDGLVEDVMTGETTTLQEHMDFILKRLNFPGVF